MKSIILVTLLICFLIHHQTKAQIRYQEQPMWCWASCIQSSLEQANVFQTQSQIVSTLSGWPQNRPARISEVIAVLNYYHFKAWQVPYAANPQQLYSTLSSGWKLIAFVNPTNNPNVGHFILLQGISSNGLIIVSDPANGSTYEQNVQQLYYAWKWSASVVVGTPGS